MNKTILTAFAFTALGPIIFILLITVPDYIGNVGDGFFMGEYLASVSALLPLCGIIFCTYLFYKKRESRVFFSIFVLLNIISLLLNCAISVSISS